MSGSERFQYIPFSRLEKGVNGFIAAAIAKGNAELLIDSGDNTVNAINALDAAAMYLAVDMMQEANYAASLIGKDKQYAQEVLLADSNGFWRELHKFLTAQRELRGFPSVPPKKEDHENS